MDLRPATLTDLRAHDLEQLRPFVGDSQRFYADPGVEHYRLLAWLGAHLTGATIFDVGTHYGESAHALAYGEHNRVCSFDIDDHLPTQRRRRQNISYFQDNLCDPDVRERWRTVLLNSPLIFVDIDPHEGSRERELLCWLQDNAYRGMVGFDDIRHFRGMREILWDPIEPAHKLDITRLGHWSGTGLVAFAPELMRGLKRAFGA